MNDFSIGSYADNIPQANAMWVRIDGYEFYFSYQTIVAVMIPGSGLYVRKNEWGPTTSKHLNLIDGGRKSSRMPGDEFEHLLANINVMCGVDEQFFAQNGGDM